MRATPQRDVVREMPVRMPDPVWPVRQNPAVGLPARHDHQRGSEPTVVVAGVGGDGLAAGVAEPGADSAVLRITRELAAVVIDVEAIGREASLKFRNGDPVAEAPASAAQPGDTVAANATTPADTRSFTEIARFTEFARFTEIARFIEITFVVGRHAQGVRPFLSITSSLPKTSGIASETLGDGPKGAERHLHEDDVRQSGILENGLQIAMTEISFAQEKLPLKPMRSTRRIPTPAARRPAAMIGVSLDWIGPRGSSFTAGVSRAGEKIMADSEVDALRRWRGTAHRQQPRSALRRRLTALVLMVGGGVACTSASAQDATVAAGEAAWDKAGCLQCHGASGEGGSGGEFPAGPSLRQTRLDRAALVEAISCGSPARRCRPGSTAPMQSASATAFPGAGSGRDHRDARAQRGRGGRVGRLSDGEVHRAAAVRGEPRCFSLSRPCGGGWGGGCGP